MAVQWMNWEKQELRRMWKAGITLRKIGVKLNKSTTTVYRMAVELGLPRRQPAPPRNRSDDPCPGEIYAKARLIREERQEEGGDTYWANTSGGCPRTGKVWCNE